MLGIWACIVIKESKRIIWWFETVEDIIALKWFTSHLTDKFYSSFCFKTEHLQASDQGSGYGAPEVDMSGHYTLKSDVYSFGVVMLELLTGRKPFDRYAYHH